MRVNGCLCVVAMLAATASPTAGADAILEGFDSPYRIPDQYIVILKEDPSMGFTSHKAVRSSKLERDNAHMSNKALITSTGQQLLGNKGVLGKTLHVSMKGFSAQMPESAARELASDSRVERIVAVMQTWETAIQHDAPWHLDRVDQQGWPLNTLYNYSSTAKFPIPNPQRLEKVILYVVDSGIRRSHNEFNGRISTNRDFVGNADGDEIGGNGDPCNGSGNGHGTLVAGVLAGATYGVAKGVEISPLRITNCQSGGNTTDMVQAIEHVTEYAENFGIHGDFAPYYNGVKYFRPILANMSVITPENSAVRKAINASLKAGVVWVVAAGNDKADACQRLPGAIPGVITVGATEVGDGLFADKHDRVWDENATQGTNWGSCVDLFAPGGKIRTSANDSNSDTEVHSGTSLAAPMVAGVAAMYLASNPTKSPAEVQAALTRVATQGKIQGDLKGSPNLMLYTAVPGNTDIPGDGGGGTNPPPPGENPKVRAAILSVINSMLLDL